MAPFGPIPLAGTDTVVFKCRQVSGGAVNIQPQVKLFHVRDLTAGSPRCSTRARRSAYSLVQSDSGSDQVGNQGTFWIIYLTGVVIAWMVGASKGKGGTGLVLGLLFSWLGVLVAFLISPSPREVARSEGRRPCPYCAEPILPQAVVCPHCHATSNRWCSRSHPPARARDGCPTPAAATPTGGGMGPRGRSGCVTSPAGLAPRTRP